MTYLEGNHISPKDEKQHLGKAVRYLRDIDIDKSGRGHFFPRIGIITEVFRRQIDFGNGDFVSFRDCKEIVLLENKNQQ